MARVWTMALLAALVVTDLVWFQHRPPARLAANVGLVLAFWAVDRRLFR